MFLGRVPKKRSKNVSRGKIDLQVFPHFLGNQCPLNLSASRILMKGGHPFLTAKFQDFFRTCLYFSRTAVVVSKA